MPHGKHGLSRQVSNGRPSEGFAEESLLEMIHGEMLKDLRERIKAAFQTHPKQSAVRIVLATDAASEDVNLQNHCSRLIHFEIPWNPNRMEQRNGRVDRHVRKQTKFTSTISLVVASIRRRCRQAGDLEADLEFLMRAALKIETIR